MQRINVLYELLVGAARRRGTARIQASTALQQTLLAACPPAVCQDKTRNHNPQLGNLGPLAGCYRQPVGDGSHHATMHHHATGRGASPRGRAVRTCVDQAGGLPALSALSPPRVGRAGGRGRFAKTGQAARRCLKFFAFAVARWGEEGGARYTTWHVCSPSSFTGGNNGTTVQHAHPHSPTQCVDAVVCHLPVVLARMV